MKPATVMPPPVQRPDSPELLQMTDGSASAASAGGSKTGGKPVTLHRNRIQTS